MKELLYGNSKKTWLLLGKAKLLYREEEK